MRLIGTKFGPVIMGMCSGGGRAPSGSGRRHASWSVTWSGGAGAAGWGIAPEAARRHNRADPMKAYLVTTATLFGLLVVVHAWRLLAEGRGVLRDRFYVGATLAALALLLWALRLLRAGRRAGD